MYFPATPLTFEAYVHLFSQPFLNIPLHLYDRLHRIQNDLKSLKVDTGDTKLDAEFRGTIKVVTDYKVQQTVPIK